MQRRGRPRHPDILTPREWEVWELLREGLSNPEIAERLKIGRESVKSHVSQILSKLHVDSREEAAQWQPPERPSGLAALLPIAWSSRDGPLRWVSIALSGALLGAVVIGLGLLAFFVLRESSSNRDALQVGAEVVLPISPTVPIDSQAVFSFDVGTGELRELPVPAALGTFLSFDDEGPKFTLVADGRVFLYGIDGTTQEIDLATGVIATGPSPAGAPILLSASTGLRSVDPASGNVEQLLNTNIQDAAFSPEGTRIAYIEDQRLGLLDVESGNAEIIAPDLTAVYLPTLYGGGHVAWSPDGDRIAFAHWTVEEPITQGRSDIHAVDADGGNLRRLTDSPRAKRYLAWSSDGTHLAYIHAIAKGEHLRALNAATGEATSLDVRVRRGEIPVWASEIELLAETFDGIALVGLDGTSQLIIAATAQCDHSLYGRRGNEIFFLTSCFVRGL